MKIYVRDLRSLGMQLETILLLLIQKNSKKILKIILKLGKLDYDHKF